MRSGTFVLMAGATDHAVPTLEVAAASAGSTGTATTDVEAVPSVDGR